MTPAILTHLFHPLSQLVLEVDDVRRRRDPDVEPDRELVGDNVHLQPEMDGEMLMPYITRVIGGVINPDCNPY
jgi:hypothetical protein